MGIAKANPVGSQRDGPQALPAPAGRVVKGMMFRVGTTTVSDEGKFGTCMCNACIDALEYFAH